jgi:hypothetical protein
MDRNGPENGSGRLGIKPDRHRENQNNPLILLPEEQPNCKRDTWLECYISYLAREHERLGGGPIGLHYLGCIRAGYREFQSTGTPKGRFGVWLGVRTLCQWLSQLRRLTT